MSGRLLVLIVGNRIPPRSAGLLAYVCQLLLQSIPNVNKERWRVLENDYEQEELLKVIDSLPDLRPNIGAPKSNGRKQA